MTNKRAATKPQKGKAKATTKLQHSNRGKSNVEDGYSFQTKKTVEEYFQELTCVCRGDSLSISSLSPLLEACPEAIQGHGEHDDTLLHHACYNKQVTREVVEYLIGLYPAAVENLTQWLPLHRACLNEDAPSNVIDYLIDRYPEALRFEWDHRGLPLHCFLGKTTNLDLYLVEKFVSAYPAALRVQNDRYGTPLHVAVGRNDVSLELIQMLANREPTALHLEHNGDLPIHTLFCQEHCPPLEVVQFFVEQAPATLVHGNAHGELALHRACFSMHNVTHAIIQLLVQACPASLAMTCEFGNLPLHNACLHANPSSEIVSLLVDENPDAVQSTNRFGMLPVDYAAGRSLEITKFLISRYPESVKHSDHDGRLPFHDACRQGSLEVVQFLFSVYPESIRHKTRGGLGDLPLHKAIEYGESKVDVIDFLIENYPESIQEKGVDGNLPFHLACEHHTGGVLVILLLFERFPGAIHTKNARGRFPLHCACLAYRTSPEAICFLISQLPYAAKVQDEDGLLPLHLVCQNRPYFREVGEVGEDLKYLNEIFPEGVRVNSPSYGLPIHCAAARGDLNAVKYLESLYPESMEFNNELLGLPLHCADKKEIFLYLLQQRYQEYFIKRGIFPLHAILQDCTITNKATVILRILRHGPAHIRDTNRQGVSPLHLAVADTDFEGHHATFLETLIGLNGEAVHTPDYQGSIPLHYALRYGASPDVVKLLLNLYPKGKYITDKLGNLPLHVACRHGSSLEVVKILVEDDEISEQALIADGQGELPLHKACRGGHVSLVLFLMEKHLSSIRLKNSAGMPPVLLMCQSSGKRRAMRETPEFLDAIWCLLKEHPDALLEALSI